MDTTIMTPAIRALILEDILPGTDAAQDVYDAVRQMDSIRHSRALDEMLSPVGTVYIEGAVLVIHTHLDSRGRIRCSSRTLPD